MEYAGDIGPKECWQALQQPDAWLVDVRTNAEWAFVGQPDLSGRTNPLISLQWQMFPSMEVDPSFGDRLQAQLNHAGADQFANLYFLCRSGVRSRFAAQAATAMGYRNAFNVSEGFEGDVNAEGHRGKTNGWQAAGLPWRQN